MKTFTLTIFALILVACSSPYIDDYQSTNPELNLQQFFNGKLIAHGMVLDMNGKLTRRFTADITGSWQDEKGILDERFIYDDGETDTRIWQLTHLGDNQYQGTAGDVIGIATGQAAGAAFYWRYDLEIKVDGEPMIVTLDDWMYLIDQDVLLNKSQIIKYGIEVGQVILSIRKL
ncbi:DUF3833 domain-containing protein [Paraglaciecola sp. L3A3]|uniref:DUF3833 domain-containing protein n=1 Tax=Paraglaciecola sp. L3A3 TaxID=2686358 RepID=UPI00131BBBD0|nr:DUF3833 domain-containing protein [Paraglaciecola sp. L3A3]